MTRAGTLATPVPMKFLNMCGTFAAPVQEVWNMLVTIMPWLSCWYSCSTILLLDIWDMWLAWLVLVLLQHQFPLNSWTCVALLQHQSKKSGTCWLQSKRQHAMFVMLVLLQHHSRSKSNTRWSCYWRQQFCSTNSYEIPRHVVGAAHGGI